MKYCIARTGIYLFSDGLVMVNVSNINRCPVHELLGTRALCALGRCHQTAQNNSSGLHYKLLSSRLCEFCKASSL